MTKPADRRLAARLIVPAQLSGPRRVRLLELSPKGARIEHPDTLNAGLMCFIDLPPALGRGTLSGRVVWTKLQRSEQTLEGERQSYYQSGLTWTELTPEQQSTLAAALTTLQTRGEAPDPAPRRGPAATE